MSEPGAYRCKHAVEAMQWFDTDPLREAFATWFEKHDAVFETLGHIVQIPEGGEAFEGDWILFSDGEFLAIGAEEFALSYEAVIR